MYKNEDIDSSNSSGRKLDFPVVGIGASAGGLDAYKAFFSQMSLNTGMAFVLAQHIPPD